MVILISFVIYLIFFYKLGNTIYRISSTGEKRFSLISLFTEGIYGPIRTLILLAIHGDFSKCIKYLWFELFRLSNPFSSIIFIIYLKKIIKYNF